MRYLIQERMKSLFKTIVKHTMIYNQEAGAIINQYNQAVSFVAGNPGSVNFPTETIWNLHKHSPGYVQKFAHTHPPKMKNISSTDEKMMRGWAIAIHPFPIYMSVITMADNRIFIEKTFMAFLEPKELWVPGTIRKIEVLPIEEETFSIDWIHFQGPEWRRKLVLRSYSFEENEHDSKRESFA